MVEVAPKRNPDWRAAELILALDAYFVLQRSGEKISDSHPLIVRTSQLLNALEIHPIEKRNAKFRDPPGVRRRFRYFDKLSAGEGINGRSEYRAVWGKYHTDLEQLRADAKDIANGILTAEDDLGPNPFEATKRDVQAILDDPKVQETEKSALVKARMGQGRFRRDLLKIWGQCAISGCRNQALLVASHIKPWAKATNHERLDPFNGLLLSPTWDRLFDLGLVTFEDDGAAVFSPYLSLEDQQALNLRNAMKIRLDQRHLRYVRYHRRYVFGA
tara:strand:- start:2817 stop:3635 length:819 start_codon:yes stop_codon:yes gene_type:complete